MCSMGFSMASPSITLDTQTPFGIASWPVTMPLAKRIKVSCSRGYTMKHTLLNSVVVGLLILPTLSNASCHQECIPAGPWESACPICNYETRTAPDCVHHISEHSGCEYSDTPNCPTQRNPI